MPVNYHDSLQPLLVMLARRSLVYWRRLIVAREFVVWNDDSIDNSVDIACHYANSDSRLKVLVVPHQGIALALKNVIACSTPTTMVDQQHCAENLAEGK